MHHNPNSKNNPEPEANSNRSYTVCSQPWWRGIGHDRFSRDMLGASTTNNSLPKQSTNDDLRTETSKSKAKGEALDEGSDANLEIQVTATSQSDGRFGEQHPPLLHAASTMHQPMFDFLTPPTQLELVGHNIACASYPYSDSYYGGVVPACGPQALVHSHCVGVHPTRMALPLEMAEEPVYVNAKQYHGILRRRQIRAKAELEKKLIKVRKPYLHESRHLHAMRRARGCGGRFLNTKKPDAHASGAAHDNDTNASVTILTRTKNNLSSRSMPPDNTGSADSSTSQQEETGPDVHETQQQKMYSNGNVKTYSIGSSNGNGFYPHHQGFQLFRYHSMPDDKVEEGDFSGQQSERIMVNGVQHRSLTIK